MNRKIFYASEAGKEKLELFIGVTFLVGLSMAKAKTVKGI
jgi:hypothetical protein